MIKYKYDITTMSVSSYDRKVSIEIPVDCDANEVFAAFKTLMVGMTFSDGAFDQAVINYFYENELDKDES